MAAAPKEREVTLSKPSKTRRTVRTPFSAQLAEFLAALEGQPRTFSAVDLEQEFGAPQSQDRRVTLKKIHESLHSAWAEGRLVAFIDADGHPLRVDAGGVNGSRATKQPLVFGTPGADAPVDGYRGVCYEEAHHLGSFATTGGHHDEHDADDGDEPVAEAEIDDAPDEDVDGDDSVVDEGIEELSIEALIERIDEYQPDEPAPSWMPDGALIHMVGVPAAITVWREGLNRAQGPERIKLITAGVPRKGPMNNASARKLGALCRVDAVWWRRTFEAALRQLREDGEIIDPADLPALHRASDVFYVEHENQYSAESVLLFGLAVGADDIGLKAVAAEMLEELDEPDPTVSALDELRSRAADMEAALAEARKQLDDANDRADTAEQRAERLSEQIETLHGAELRAGTADERLQQAEARARQLTDEVAALRVRAERSDVEAERSVALERQLAEMARTRDELAAAAERAGTERRMREQSDARLQEQVAEVRHLERRLAEAEQQGVRVPVDDAAGLLGALTRPLGEAAEHAARRLREGRPHPDDAKLLQFAGSFGELAATVGPAAAPDATSQAPARDTALDPPARSEAPVATEPVASAPQPVTQPESPALHPEPEPDSVSTPGPAIRRRGRRTAPFTVQPFGGAGEVGGSAIAVSTLSGHTVLLDAGQRVKGEYGIDTNAPFHNTLPGVDELDAIVVSHAHIDHVGSLPVLYDEYSRGRDRELPVFMSDPTRRLSEVMLRDSAKIQHKRAMLNAGSFAELAQSDFAPELDLKPAYNDREINEVLGAATILDRNADALIPSTSLTVKLVPVAHVLGSCAVLLTDNETGATLLYTGDLGPMRDTQRTLPDFNGVHGLPQADVVIMESTYAAQNANEKEGKRAPGASREAQLRELFRTARKAFDAGGHVLLPAFSLGRTQELLRLIELHAGDELPDGEVYIGGMGEQITQIYADHQGTGWVEPGALRRATEMNKWLRDGMRFDEVVEDVLDRDPSYIIVSPAMLSGGWSRAFLSRMVTEEQHAVMFTGYLPRHGGGIRNLSHLHTGAKIGLDDQQLPIRCQWKQATLSAHAPAGDLHAFAQRMLLGREHVAFGAVHGSQDAQAALIEHISDLENASAVSLSNGMPWKPPRG